jgi:16S rRNA (cytidine1402-2'-O)-methyltransferase
MNQPIDDTTPKAKQQGLYLVSTPIGNLRDITLRALDILKECDAVICEDTRITAKLLNAYAISKKMLVYNDHATESERDAIIQKLENGQTLALVSDAGTPLLSDPGFKLVEACKAKNIAVIPVPGPSAILPALQISGLASDRFLFAGFLPHKSAARKTLFEELKNISATLIFYESPNRIAESVKDAYAVLGNRKASLVREITKVFEESHTGTLENWAADEKALGTLKGEMVLLIEKSQKTAMPEQEIRQALITAMKTMSAKDAVSFVTDLSGQSKKTVYDMALKIKK